MIRTCIARLSRAAVEHDAIQIKFTLITCTFTAHLHAKNVYYVFLEIASLGLFRIELSINAHDPFPRPYKGFFFVWKISQPLKCKRTIIVILPRLII